MRPSGNSSASWCSSVRSYSLVGRLPSHGLDFLPSTLRKAANCNCHRARKRKLGSRKNANRHSKIFRRSEAACASTKVMCGEFVANLCRPRPDELKAVVAHYGNSLSEAPSSTNISALSIRPHLKIAQIKGAAVILSRALAPTRVISGDMRPVRRMSALGQKQTCAVQKGMSALPPCVDGSELARTFFTFAALVGAPMCSACVCGTRGRWP